MVPFFPSFLSFRLFLFTFIYIPPDYDFIEEDDSNKTSSSIPTPATPPAAVATPAPSAPVTDSPKPPAPTEAVKSAVQPEQPASPSLAKLIPASSTYVLTISDTASSKPDNVELADPDDYEFYDEEETEPAKSDPVTVIQATPTKTDQSTTNNPPAPVDSPSVKRAEVLVLNDKGVNSTEDVKLLEEDEFEFYDEDDPSPSVDSNASVKTDATSETKEAPAVKPSIPSGPRSAGATAPRGANPQRVLRGRGQAPRGAPRGAGTPPAGNPPSGMRALARGSQPATTRGAPTTRARGSQVPRGSAPPPK